MATIWSLSFLSVSADKEEKVSFVIKNSPNEKNWRQIGFLERSDKYLFSFVSLKAKDSTFPKGTTHLKCKSAFTMKYKKSLLKNGEKINALEAGNN